MSAEALLRELHSAFLDMASLRRLSVHPWERDNAYAAHEVARRVSAYLSASDAPNPNNHMPGGRVK